MVAASKVAAQARLQRLSDTVSTEASHLDGEKESLASSETVSVPLSFGEQLVLQTYLRGRQRPYDRRRQEELAVPRKRVDEGLKPQVPAKTLPQGQIDEICSRLSQTKISIPRVPGGEEALAQRRQAERAKRVALDVDAMLERLATPRIPRSRSPTSGEKLVLQYKERQASRPVDHERVAQLALPKKRGASCLSWGVRPDWQRPQRTPAEPSEPSEPSEPLSPRGPMTMAALRQRVAEELAEGLDASPAPSPPLTDRSRPGARPRPRPEPELGLGPVPAPAPAPVPVPGIEPRPPSTSSTGSRARVSPSVSAGTPSSVRLPPLRNELPSLHAGSNAGPPSPRSEEGFPTLHEWPIQSVGGRGAGEAEGEGDPGPEQDLSGRGRGKAKRGRPRPRVRDRDRDAEPDLDSGTAPALFTDPGSYPGPDPHSDPGPYSDPCPDPYVDSRLDPHPHPEDPDPGHHLSSMSAEFPWPHIRAGQESGAGIGAGSGAAGWGADVGADADADADTDLDGDADPPFPGFGPDVEGPEVAEEMAEEDPTDQPLPLPLPLPPPQPPSLSAPSARGRGRAREREEGMAGEDPNGHDQLLMELLAAEQRPQPASFLRHSTPSWARAFPELPEERRGRSGPGPDAGHSETWRSGVDAP